jgi:hypothetical protein
MSYAEATPGPRNIEAAQRLAAALHPERKISVQRVEFSQESCREQASPHLPTCRPRTSRSAFAGHHPAQPGRRLYRRPDGDRGLAARLETAMTAAGRPVQQVSTAYVDRAQPTLNEALDLCAGARTILILPVMVPDEASLRRWLHKLIMRWRAARDSSQPSPRLVLVNRCCSCPD